jgi:hypothetical protein
MKNYEVKAFIFTDGEYKLMEFASGLSHRHARETFQRWSANNNYAAINMKAI